MRAAEFAIALDEWYRDEVEGAVQIIAQKLMMEGLSRIVYRSPVDTGRFRGNWTVSLDGPQSGTREVDDKNGGATVAEGNAVAQQAKAFQIIYMQNNLPYGPRLEGGWSKQAPGGFLAITFKELEAMVA